jgi:hypothetical protein
MKFDDIKYLFTNTTKFFNDVKKESFKRSFLIYFTFGIIINAMASVMYTKDFNLEFFYYPAIFLGTLILSVASFFVVGGIIHLFILMFKGEGDYFQTLKASAYGAIPSMIISIPVQGFLLVFTSDMVAIATLVITLPVTIYAIYLNVVGLSIFHKISKAKAFLSGFIPIAIIMTIVMIFAIMISALSIFGGI